MFAPISSATRQVFPAGAMLGLAPWMTPSAKEAPSAKTGPASREEAAGTVLHFAQDRALYVEGDEAVSFFKVLSGVVRTCKFLSDGRRQIDGFQTAGDMFGVEAGSAHSFSAEAVSDCTVMAYCRRGFEISMARDVELSQRAFSYAMRSLARARDHALLLGRRSAMEKVATFLIDWAARSPDPGTVVLAMTRQDIADYLGLTIETVSRTLSQLEREAVIELSSARQIHLRDPRALQALNS